MPGVGETVGVAVGVDVEVGSGALVGVLNGCSITTSVAVGGTAVGAGVGSDCWQADMVPATSDDSASSEKKIVAARSFRTITESRIRIWKHRSSQER